MKHFRYDVVLGWVDTGCPCAACFSFYGEKRFNEIALRKGITAAYAWRDAEEQRLGYTIRGFRLPVNGGRL